jgi:hypothetical protein
MSIINTSELTSYEGVKNLLNSSTAVQQVLSHRNSNCSAENNPGARNFCGRWIVLPIALLPIVIGAAAIVLHSAVMFVFAISFAIAFPISFISAWYFRNDPDVSKAIPGVTHLISTKNNPSVKARPLNELAPIEVTDPRLQKRLFTPKQIIKFQHHQGICRGEANWFLKLYLQTRQQFSDPSAHMMALGKLFEQGGPQESVLLQSLFIRGGKLLDLKIGMPKQKWFEKLLKLDNEAIQLQLPSAIRRFEKLPLGAYQLGFPGHATAFVKVSNDLSYFFDPNDGIYEIKGTQQGEAAFTLFADVIKYLAESNEGRVAKENRIGFVPCQLRKA